MLGLLSYLYSPFGLLSLALLVVCVVHAIRNNTIFPWIYVMVFLPSIGPAIYFFMEILPGLLRSRGLRSAQAGIVRTIDPNRDYRQALRAADLVGSVDSKRALAEHYAARGQFGEAVALYKDILHGQFADDPVLLMGLARAQFNGGDGAGAQASLEQFFTSNPKFISEEAHMIYARALELQGRNEDAAEEYGRLVSYFAGEEARARYAAILAKLGRADEARAINAQIVKNLTGAPRRYRSTQRPWGDMAKQALK